MTKALKISILFVALYAICFTAVGATVSIATAQTAAVNFFNLTATNAGRNVVTATLVYTKTETDGTVDFYVFDISPAKGFVIISGDDQVKPVIAYSLESNFRLDTKGHGVQNWMNDAGVHIYHGIQQGTVANEQITSQWNSYLQGVKPVSAKSLASAVAPLLTTTWDQEPFYNQLCPFNTTDNQHAVTGCVATTMAQIMKFWNYPAQGIGSYGYFDGPPTCSNIYGDQYADFGATTYNWAAMPDIINSNNTNIATLMYQCGVAVAMNYGDDNQGGSGAYVLNSQAPSWQQTAQKAYASFFGYNPNTLTGVNESDYASADWINLLEKELNAGRPIQYLGVDTIYGGHTWVCDGYDENDMMHMNWGWSGLDDGYFSVSSLTTDGYNFSNSEAALIGIEPATDLAVSINASTTSICSTGSTTLIAQGSTDVSYLWSPANGLSCPTCATTTATPDTTTTYTVTIDSAGFTAISQVTVMVSNIKASSAKVVNVACYGGNNGKAVVNVSGGYPGYTYDWSTGGSNQLITDLTAGDYGVTITDIIGCTASAEFTITQPDPLIANIQAANSACSLDNASLNVVVNGGTPAYSYAWSGGQQDTTIFSLAEGLYSITVTDTAGCSASSSFNVVQPTPMSVAIFSSNTTCSLLYATATANVTGGHENFSFAWNNGETTSSITNLSAGSFSVTVTDSLGCSAYNSALFTQPDSMNVYIATSNAANDKVYGKAVANVTGGTPQYSFFWNTGDTTESIAYTALGTYSVTITDSKGCSQSAATQITDTTTTGLTQIGDVVFEVYPNPATNSVTVDFENNTGENATIELKSILGQTLITGEISATQTQLNLSEFANGIYFVAITQGQHTVVKQIVVKK